MYREETSAPPPPRSAFTKLFGRKSPPGKASTEPLSCDPSTAAAGVVEVSDVESHTSGSRYHDDGDQVGDQIEVEAGHNLSEDWTASEDTSGFSREETVAVDNRGACPIDVYVPGVDESGDKDMPTIAEFSGDEENPLEKMDETEGIYEDDNNSGSEEAEEQNDEKHSTLAQ